MTRLAPNQTAALLAHEKSGSAEAFKMPAPVRRKRDNEEWRIQSDFFRWWRGACKDLGIWPGCMWHVPNGSMLGDNKQARIIRSRMLTLAGVWPGVVDVFLMVPMLHLFAAPAMSHLPGTKSWDHGAFIEFKKPSLRAAKNGGLSDEQQEFIGNALARGYSCHVCYSWEEGRDVVLKYLTAQPATDHHSELIALRSEVSRLRLCVNVNNPEPIVNVGPVRGV